MYTKQLMLTPRRSGGNCFKLMADTALRHRVRYVELRCHTLRVDIRCAPGRNDPVVYLSPEIQVLASLTAYLLIYLSTHDLSTHDKDACFRQLRKHLNKMDNSLCSSDR